MQSQVISEPKMSAGPPQPGPPHLELEETSLGRCHQDGLQEACGLLRRRLGAVGPGRSHTDREQELQTKGQPFPGKGCLGGRWRDGVSTRVRGESWKTQEERSTKDFPKAESLLSSSLALWWVLGECLGASLSLKSIWFACICVLPLCVYMYHV